jgi:polyphosphate kinase
MSLNNPDYFINRELSWLDFNFRVLEEARSKDNPLLERLKFLGIVASNLDEFFMVRVAGTIRLMEADNKVTTPDGRTPAEQLSDIMKKVRKLWSEMETTFGKELYPELKKNGINILKGKEAAEAARTEGAAIFEQQLMPILTPTAIDQGHPVPALTNKGIYSLVELDGMPKTKLPAPSRVIIQLPSTLPRFVRLKDAGGKRRYILFGDIVDANIHLLYPEATKIRTARFRITRDSDFTVDEEGAEDLLKAIETELIMRKQRAPVRLECSAEIDDTMLKRLLDDVELEPDDVFKTAHIVDFSELLGFAEGINRPELKYQPKLPIQLFEKDNRTIFEIIREKDRILYHPYHSFEPVERLVTEAARDPKVLAIKQTLYRTSSESPIIAALEEAALSGKHVTVLVELKARFDEQRNIEWARRLERAGAHVIYGLVGLKTHCKVLLVMRQDDDGIRRYVHLGTGNYNSKTARLYTDLGLLSCHEQLGTEVAELFNVITGYTSPRKWKLIDMSPISLRRKLILMLRRESEFAKKGRPARVIAKMNSLVDPDIIKALYEASQAGVQIDLIIRGICCLRPGLKGISENISVYSIVGRYLEHARVFYFNAGGADEVYLASADWMPRNLDRRIELMFPILEKELRKVIIDILILQLSDTAKRHELGSDGTYVKITKSGKKGKPLNSQDDQFKQLEVYVANLKSSRRSPLQFQPATAPQ